MNRLSLAAVLAALLLIPSQGLACACGCGVFDVGSGELTPSGPGGVVSLEYDFMNQNRNWSGVRRAPAQDNADKQIRTDFFTLTGQYMVSRDWSVMAVVPVWNRLFRTDDGAGVEPFRHAALGDISLEATYSGFAKDMSTGVSFGIKLPTGDFRYTGFDRDTSIGSGSTDLILGAYHVGQIRPSSRWGYFVQARGEIPLANQDGYRPGQEVDAAAGVRYEAPAFADGRMRLTPSLQLVASVRARDNGPAADPPNSGYSRLMISPGVAFDVDQWRLYADVEVPLYQDVRGNQLVAPEMVKVVVSRSF
jgi:hypothetical protein